MYINQSIIIPLYTVNDAYGQLPLSGGMEGNYFALGNYFSCLETATLAPRETPIQGRYCHVAHWFSFPIEFGKQARMNPLLPSPPLAEDLHEYIYDVRKKMHRMV